ncbi:MAG: gliding motility lipoprotein GldH [Mucilaginibacter sp.]|jgi:gliding motility-associated lipoprotein GldH|nr:gliding motility lipoprotein GldH [Mucilaginibacter sp.]
MTRALIHVWLIAVAATLLTTGCSDSKAVIDLNSPVPGHNWTYPNKFRYAVKIDDEKKPYNLYMNLRVTADYKYSNLFVLITQTGPDKKPVIKRYELKLATKEGEWLGQGSGNLYSYQVPYKTNFKFPGKGLYQITIEQNMRDNPLREVSDVGLRVEKSE